MQTDAALKAFGARLRQLRDRLWNRLQERLGNRVVLNGHLEQRLPNTLNVNFVGQVGAELLRPVQCKPAHHGQIGSLSKGQAAETDRTRSLVRLHSTTFATATKSCLPSIRIPNADLLALD